MAIQTGTGTEAGQVRFEKVLWRQQPFPDNHVAESFLSDLRTNSQVVLPSWAELAIASLRISARFLSVVLFALLFVHLHLGTVDAELLLVSLITVLVVSSLASAPGFFRRRRSSSGGSKGRAVGGVLSKTVMGLVLLAVSPVLRTLTESTTSDSIWALAAVLFFVHLALADYERTAQAKKLSSTLSFNAAMSASVVLASRLDSDSHTFTLLALAIVLFAPSNRSTPFTSGQSTGQSRSRSRSRSRGSVEDVVRFAALYSGTVGCGVWFAAVQPKGEAEWVWVVLGWTTVVVGFVSGVCPWWIRVAQGWKMEIKGPWDPAEPILSSTPHF